MSTWVARTVMSLAHIKAKVVGIAIGYAKTVVTATYGWVTAALEWHRRKLLTDAAYPLALMAIGKAVIRISVPKAALAAALIALLAELLGGLQRPRWMDDHDEWDT
jgi:hypothetical protein